MQSAMQKKSKLRNFMFQMDGLKDGTLDSMFLSKEEKEKAVTPEITSSWWGTHNDGKSPIKVYCALWENFTIKETTDKDRCIFTPFSNFFGIYKAIEK